MARCLAVAVLGAALALAHSGQDQEAISAISGPHQGLWYNNLPGDGGTQADSVFSGISTFGRLPYAPCLSDEKISYDIAFLGAPFDTGTSYRPGARFGPSGIRQGSRRLNLYGGYNVPLATNPFSSWSTVLDCGDVPVTSYDNAVALEQIENGHYSLLSRQPKTDGKKKGYGKPKVFGGNLSTTASINHGTYFWHASREHLLRNDSNLHLGIRTTVSGLSDYENDGYCGFEIVEAREIDTIGTEGIIKRIYDRVGTTNPVYLSLDIDTLDPAFAPATGTPESAGWSTRELRTILRGLEGINLIGADLVEVAPAYDTNAELTTIAAADALFEIMSIMVKRGPLSLPDDEDGEL